MFSLVLHLRRKRFCLLLLFTAASPAFGTETPLSGLETASLIEAAQAPGTTAFDRAVRDALQRYPSQREALLQYAIALRPDWAAGLIGDALNPASPESSEPVEMPEVLTVPAAVPAAVEAAETAPSPDSEAGAVSKPASKPAFTGSVDFGGILRSGNTENAGLKGELKLNYRSEQWQHRAKAEAGYLESSTEPLEQRFEVEYEVNYDITESVFGFGLLNYTDDRFSGFDFETLTAGGIGLNLFSGDPLTWKITMGPSLRYAEFSDSEDTETVPGARLTNDVAWQVSDDALLANETEVLWDRERVTLENDTSLKLRIVDKLSGKLSLNTRYRSNVPDDTETTDTTTRASVVYDF